MLERLKAAGFDVEALHHAEAILQHDMPAALAEVEEVLLDMSIPIAEIVQGGGGEAPFTQRLRRAFASRGWTKRTIEIKKLVNGRETTSLSHEIDHVRAIDPWLIALEIEWNNKDPFFDRDLESFKRLHADGAISVGTIITRGRSLHENLRALIRRFAEANNISDIAGLEPFKYRPTIRQQKNIQGRTARGKSFREAWVDAFVSDKFGEATTHWRKLHDRVNRGVGNPCPLLLIGLPQTVVAD